MKRRLVLFGLWTLFITAFTQAQTDTLRICLRPYSVAIAEYSYRDGNFGWSALPASTYTYRVYSESLQTLGKVSVYGKLGYKQQRNCQQNWNSMTGTYWEGVTLCDSVSGNQRAEQYQLTGAFALPLHRCWWVGAQFDYEVQQTAKDVDPRNSNQWMAWTFTPGVRYRCGNFCTGISLRYASRRESVDIRNMGLHNSFPIFAAYPLSFFSTQPQNEEQSWYYSGHEAGAALQLDVNRTSFHLFQQLCADLLGQEVESDRVQSRSENETDGWQAIYRATLRHGAGRTRHEWNWRVHLRQTKNYDPLQRQAVSAPWESYGRVLRSTHRTGEGDFTYRYEWFNRNCFPLFSFLTGAHYQHEKRALFFYPAVFTQSIHRFTVHGTLTRSFVLPHQALFDITIGGRYGKGGGTLLHEKQLSADEKPDIRLWQNLTLRQQAFDYGIMPRWALNAALIYTRSIPRTALSCFFRLSGEYERMPRTLNFTTKDETTASIGLLF